MNSTTELLLRLNGIQPAFGFEFGMDSPRANEARAGNPYRQANVSFSFVQRRQGAIVHHTLIDCGMGVVPSLLEFEESHGVHVVDDYSGYEDREHPQEPVYGPLGQQQLRRELRRVAGGRDIQVAEHGMILGDNVPWPG